MDGSGAASPFSSPVCRQYGLVANPHLLVNSQLTSRCQREVKESRVLVTNPSVYLGYSCRHLSDPQKADRTETDISRCSSYRMH
eukprot:scaffold1618_cov397-Prasinococcus_capsulatus_cf.AAC.1